MTNIHHLIKDLYRLDYSNLKVIDDLIGNIEAHLSAHGSDLKLELALHTIKARKQDELNSGFDKVCEAAEFVVNKLKDQEDWDIIEFDIFCAVLGNIKSYKLTVSMMDKSLDMLERNFKNLPDYEYRKARIFTEMTWRLLRAKFLDQIDPQEVKKLFDTCVKSAMHIWEKLGHVAIRTNLLVREAIFNGNPDEILKCVRAVEDTRDKYWIKSSKDETVEYIRFLKPNVTLELHNFMFGWQIKKRRKELGIGTMELANMIGSTQNMINEIERGVKGIGVERIYVIMQALQVQNPSYFFGEPLVSASVVAKDIHEYQAMQLMSGMSEKTKDAAVDFLKKLVELRQK